MKVQYEYDGYPRLLNFLIEEDGAGFLCTLKTSKDTEKAKDIVDFNSNKNVIQIGLKKYIEERISTPLLFDNDYTGEGYRFKIRMDLLITKLQ